MARAADIIKAIRELAPEELAEPWDSSGLQVGDPGITVERMLLALDVTHAVLDEAASLGARLLLAHHPVIMKPLTRVSADDPQGSLVLRAAREGIVIYAAHTNLDAAPGGVNDVLAEIVGLRDVEPLAMTTGPGEVKLVTFVPPDSLETVRHALCERGAGVIGEYKCCSFSSPGQGTFTPSEAASPAVGERGVVNRVDEIRLEMLVAPSLVEEVVAALRAAHPYEEPACDLYSLTAYARGGIGRVGNWPGRGTLRELAAVCGERLGAPRIRFAGEGAARVERIAVCGGAGKDLVEAAARAGAQVLLTGEAGHHAALTARVLGLSLIEAGHYHTERVVLEPLRNALAERLVGAGIEVDIKLSEIDTNPWEVA
ncbi:MAG: Nif3-like dinuclear metal center hexameric protein [Candidatus Geothermincolia bacterium]